MMRVVIVPSFYPTPESPLKGVFFLEQVRALAAHTRAELSVVALEARSLRDLSARSVWRQHFQLSIADEEGIPTRRRHGWNPLLGTTTGGRLWASILGRDVSRVLRTRGEAIIHAHNALWAGYAVRELGHRFGVPVVLTEHSSEFLDRTPAARLQYASTAWAAADAVIAVSNALAGAVEGAGGGHVRVIPNTVDTEFFTPPPSRQNDPFVFLTVAHLVPVKGIDTLIEAFAEAFHDRPEVRLQIAGGGAQMRDLQTLAVARGVAPRITFLGPLTRSQVRLAMHGATAYVQPSRRETFGLAIAEAMACGLPVVATRSGGPESIVDAETGILVPLGDSLELAKGLDQMRRSVQSYRGDVIRNSIVRRFSPPVVARQILDVYEEVIS